MRAYNLYRYGDIDTNMRIAEKIVQILGERTYTQRELWERLNVSRSYLSETLTKLEKEKVIKRKKISQRTVLVSLNKDNILRIGLLKASEYAAVFLTVADLNYPKCYITLYNNSLEELKDLLLNTIDIALAPIVSGLLFHIIDDRIVVVSGCARGGAGIVYNNTPHKIGSTLFSTMDLKSRIFSNFNLDKIEYFQSPEQLIKNFKLKKINAITIWEPYFSALSAKNKIMVGRDTMCCGVMVMRDKIDEKLKIFLKKFSENTELLKVKKRWKTAAILMKQYLDFNTKLLYNSLNSYTFDLTLSEAEIIRDVESLGLPLAHSKIQSFLKKLLSTLH